MKNRCKNTLLIAAALTLSLFTYDTMTAQEIRAVHLLPDAAGADAYFGDTVLPAAPGLTFGSASAAMPMAAGTVRVIVTPQGAPVLRVIDADVTISANTRTNVLIIGTSSAIEGNTLDFAVTSATHPDTAYVRTAHVSPNSGAYNIRITDSKGAAHNLSNMPYKGTSSFMALPVGKTTVTLFAPGTQNVVLHASGQLTGGTYGTLFITGLASGLRLRLLNESSSAMQSPMAEFTPIIAAGNARIRTVHTVPDGPAIDIFFDTTRAISSLVFRDASTSLPHASGSIQVGITLAGQPASSAVLSNPLTVNPDTAYTVIAVGSLSGGGLDALALGSPLNETAPTDSVRVRLLHASPDAGAVDITITDASGSKHNLTNMAFKAKSAYMTLPRGAISVDVAATGGASIYKASGTLSSAIVTLLTTGNIGGAIPNFKVNALFDSDTAQQRPMMELTQAIVDKTGKIRLVHVVPDIGAIDVFVANNATAAASIAFRDASAAMEIQGISNVKIAPAGAGIGAALLNADVEAMQDTLQTIIALGSLSAGNLGALTLQTAPTDVASQGSMKVRLLHASPDAGTVDIEIGYSDGGSMKVAGVKFNDNTAYTSMPSGATTVTVYRGGTRTAILSVGGDLPDAATMTAIVSGSVAGETIGVNVLFDSQDPAQKPMMLLTPIPLSVDDRLAMQGRAMMLAPNPSSSHAELTYTLDRRNDVRLDIFDNVGTLIAVVDPAEQEAGTYRLSTPVSTLATGTYTVVLHGDDGMRIGSEVMVVVR